MAEHRLKLHNHYWEAVMSGEKNFEIRNNDRGFQRGDKVIFYQDLGNLAAEGLVSFEITYVFSHEWIQHGYVVFGMKPVGPS
jgi:ASC-1-like (ASCH) protein